ncbi:hypothetical protein WH91_16050 [Devosia psychrophila]|uniref:Uncharacterized protein n=2 Tax=Devosia psychrophila TaxID=728005 RepID=A0ABR5DVM6_9HYPH|nr:hypothetical protein WH91_16050 [Devosia psychrophila]
MSSSIMLLRVSVTDRCLSSCRRREEGFARVADLLASEDDRTVEDLTDKEKDLLAKFREDIPTALLIGASEIQWMFQFELTKYLKHKRAAYHKAGKPKDFFFKAYKRDTFRTYIEYLCNSKCAYCETYYYSARPGGHRALQAWTRC